LATALGKIATHPDRHVLRASVGIRQGSRSRAERRLGCVD